MFHEDSTLSSLASYDIADLLPCNNSPVRVHHRIQGRCQLFCLEGLLRFLSGPIDNRAPEALIARRGPGMCCARKKKRNPPIEICKGSTGP